MFEARSEDDASDCEGAVTLSVVSACTSLKGKDGTNNEVESIQTNSFCFFMEIPLLKYISLLCTNGCLTWYTKSSIMTSC